MTLGYRESTDSWAAVLRDLRERGLDAPLLAIGDGGLALWAALREVYPRPATSVAGTTGLRNVLDRLPKRLWPDARGQLRQVWEASTRAGCEHPATSWRSGSTSTGRTARPRRSTATRTTSSPLRLPGRALAPPADLQPDIR